MNVFLLYLLLLKATVTTFSGQASVPIVRNDLVLRRHVLTDRERTTSLAITRTPPGPMGLYVVSVGYFVNGTPGAFAGWLAMTMPALLMIPLLEFVRRKAEHPRLNAVLRCVVFASAGLLLWVTVRLARDAIHGYLTLGIALVAFALGIRKKVDSLWIVLSAAVLTVLASS